MIGLIVILLPVVGCAVSVMYVRGRAIHWDQSALTTDPRSFPYPQAEERE